MGTDKYIYGFIAQEIKQAMDDAGVEDFNGWGQDEDGRQRVSKELMVVPLVKAVQELSKKVEELESKLNA